MSKELNLIKALITALGYQDEVDKVIDGETFYTVTKIKKDRKENNVITDQFLKFWNFYPRKDNRKGAAISFSRLKKADIILIMHDITSRYDGTEKQYIPHATTYINGEMWLNERITQSVRKGPNSERVANVLQQIGNNSKSENAVRQNSFARRLDN